MIYRGDLIGTNSQYVSVDLYICDNGHHCQDTDSIFTQISGSYLYYLYVDAKYDYDNLTNPIRYNINYNNRILVDPNYYNLNIHSLHANVAYNNDNTTTTFYSVDYGKSLSDYPQLPFLATVYFLMSREYNVYVPYVNYQPVRATNRRELASNGDENIMSQHYFVFYLISQIGGFFAFFTLFIGSKIKSINESYLMYKMINEYHEILNYESQQQDEKDNLQDHNNEQ